MNGRPARGRVLWKPAACLVVFLILSALLPVMADQPLTRTVSDSYGREVTIPAEPERVVCSGAGALRYLTYLGREDAIAGIDAMDAGSSFGKPYAMANPQFSSYPVIGDFKGTGHGSDNLEALIDLSPDLIIKTYETEAAVGEEEEKLGIPILYLEYGDLGENRDAMYSSLRILGDAMGASDRAEEVIGFFNDEIADLESRTGGIPDTDRPTVYVGGINYYQTLGIDSTEPTYPPFILVHANNVAEDTGIEHATVSREEIIDWDPEYLFLDVGGSALDDLSRDAALYRDLTAVKNGNIHGVLPYNYFTTNQDTVLANAYYIGKVLYPDEFSDIEPMKKADEIFTFLDGKPVFSDLNGQFNSTGFRQVSLPL